MKKLAVLGPKGTYSDLGAQIYLKNSREDIEIEYFNSFYSVFKNIKDYALIPIENSLAGYVGENLDFLMDSDYKVIHQVKLRVDFSLVGSKNMKRIYVQIIAYEECKEFFFNHDYEVIKCNSNSEVLNRYLNDLNESGAILPKHLIKPEFEEIDTNIGDSNYNETRFFVLDKKWTLPDCDDYVFSLVIESKNDRSGILYEILSVFNQLNINLLGIASRPLKTKIGEYKFFIECEIKKEKAYDIRLLFDILNKTFDAKFLGIYNKI